MYVRRRLVAVSLLLVCTATWLAVRAAEETPAPLRPGRLPKEERKALIDGLMVTFRHSKSGATDTRESRLAAIYVPDGEPPTPFLPNGPFTAKLEGYLKLRLRGDYTFSVKGRGTVKVKINGKDLLASAGDDDLTTIKPVLVSLVKGYNKLDIDYARPQQGDAVLRVYWQGDEFPTEPLPPTELRCDSRKESLVAGLEHRQGRELYATRRCFACHDSGTDLAGSRPFMPEIGAKPPALTGAGSRFNSQWMARWILNPRSMRTKTTMPQVFAGLDEESAELSARHIAAYLASVVADKPPKKLVATDGLAGKGEILYEDLGCLACHKLEAPSDEEDEFDRASLYYVGAKFSDGALAAFLKNPRAHYPWSRMPRFPLTDEQAGQLAAFLRKSSKGKIESQGGGDAKLGAKLYASSGCANCHLLGKGDPKPPRHAVIAAKPAAKGCLSIESKSAGKAPNFGFDVPQQKSLIAFLSTDRTSLGRVTPVEFSRRTAKRVNCTACHRRDNLDSDLPYILPEEGVQGHPPEVLPSLSFVGEKLHPAWSSKLLAGTLRYRPRPHLKGRMPGFPARAKLLSIGLSAEHGFAENYVDGPKADVALAKIGHGLTQREGGFNCVQCHGVGDRPPTAAFDAKSTNLAFARDRLRFEYYFRWLMFPQRIEPATKMPRFAPDGKKTGLTHVYDGDAPRQYHALWHYLGTLQKKKPATEKKSRKK